MHWGIGAALSISLIAYDICVLPMSWLTLDPSQSGMATDGLPDSIQHRAGVLSLRRARNCVHEAWYSGDGPVPDQVRLQRQSNYALLVHDAGGSPSSLPQRIFRPALRWIRQERPSLG